MGLVIHDTMQLPAVRRKRHRYTDCCVMPTEAGIQVLDNSRFSPEPVPAQAITGITERDLSEFHNKLMPLNEGF